MFECGTCIKVFPAGWRARENHCNATGHRRPLFECDTCFRVCASESARRQHMKDKNHFKWECDHCVETWPTEDALKSHEIDDHLYCADCDRHFNNDNNIRMHLRSRIHQGTDIVCPFCKTRFTTATGLCHHLERGACPNAPDLDRDTIYMTVRRLDPDGVISKKLIGWHGSDKYEATGRAWNGYAWACYLCQRTFKTCDSLNQHLNSPVHQQALYHCPKCRREYTTLAGIINHLESESCGFMRFETVQRNIDGLVRGNRLLGF
ncbi:hypothetical protein M406DRAFT_287495 [Cryphonectria parasitica EP155]|uniref:C2H2-type domain-containing protein n=1 Tax=Cryphonectria parasitica (strain ATCC 38755 / EP155) TaxID=660469 RepID=A0A9P5CTQ0_CRYP1|nr:uncharacterized protein M406DRAFT_287495 [Cryphonectria parasitica EP155]KAF3769355.1 hypothetical protein M406DRAFT_287495 [Cryphonectria parasitica EP155]